MKTLKELFLDELADMYDAEHRIIKALPKLARAVTCPELKKVILTHLKETEGQVKKLEQVFKFLGLKARGKTCEATVGLLQEGDEIAAEFKGSPAINAALIAAVQKVEHYEIASYGCLHAWAELMENKEAAGLLKKILDEEKGADEALNELAYSSLNQEALDGSRTNGSHRKSSGSRPANRRRSGRLGGVGRNRLHSLHR